MEKGFDFVIKNKLSPRETRVCKVLLSGPTNFEDLQTELKDIKKTNLKTILLILRNKNVIKSVNYLDKRVYYELIV